MTASEFSTALASLGLTTQAEAAAELHVTQSRISEWTSGRRPVPSYIGRLVRALIENDELRANMAPATARRTRRRASAPA